jgi:Na+/H+-dicarboxylate symporter
MLNKLIALGLILGLLVGLGAAATGHPALLWVAKASAPFGALFVNAVKMIVIPLVVSVIFASVARLGDLKALGRLGGTAGAYYFATLIPAVAIGMGVSALALRFVPEVALPDADAVTVPALQSLSDFFVQLIPSNIFAAASAGRILPLVVFAALLAAATATLEPARRDRLVQGAEDIGAALIKLVWWILWLAPIGVFGLIAPATAAMGWGLVQSLGVFILAVGIGLLIFVALIYLPTFAGMQRKPLSTIKSLGGAIGIAVSTTSTATAIPVTLEETQKLGVSATTAELLVPLGASLYRPGSALFQGAAIIFLAHLYGVPVGMGSVIAVLFATLLVSLTVAPVPSSGVVTMAPALDAIGVPVAGLALLLGVDRLPDMMRSGVNVLGQATTAVVADGRL